MVETVSRNCQNLTTYQITFSLAQVIDDWNSFGFIAVCTFVIAVFHDDWILVSMTCLPKHCNWKIFLDGLVSNSAFHLVLVPSSYISLGINIILKIDQSLSKFGVDEWHFIRSKVNDLVHDTFWVVVDLDESIKVYYRWTDVQQKWCVGSVILKIAFAGILTL